jgi:hypothetical protein
MSKYYIYYPRDFANEYSLIRVDDAAQESRLLGWYERHSTEENDLHRISVQAMRGKISNERYARKHDQAFSGYGDTKPETVDEFLFPWWADRQDEKEGAAC